MIEERFDGLVGVVKSVEEGVIVLDISRRDIGVCSVDMIKDGTGGGFPIYHVLMTEGMD